MGVVLAANGGALETMAKPVRMYAGAAIGSGKQWLPWIHINDLCRQFLMAIENPEWQGIYNGVAPNPVTNLEFTKTLGDVPNRPTLLPTPLLPIKAVYGSELVETLMLGSLRVVGVKLVEDGFEFRHPVLEDALRATI